MELVLMTEKIIIELKPTYWGYEIVTVREDGE